MSAVIGERETFSLVGRAMGYVWPYRRQVLVKLALGLIAATVVLILPWPIKIMIDHVIMNMPIGSSPTPYPPYVEPFVMMLDGLSPTEIIWVLVGVGLVLITLIGAFGNQGYQRDATNAGLAQGLDTATRSENLANVSDSAISGLLGLYEYRYQLRTTHRLNHYLRSTLFSRLLALPMTRFSDASIGDAVYRVMYDTPSISRICYDLWIVPVLSLYSIAIIIWTTGHSYSSVPSLVWAAWAVLPLSLVGTLLLTGQARRRSMASREAGADTTASLEEGMSNIVAVQSLGANDRERKRFETDSEESFKRFRAYTLVSLAVTALGWAVAMAMVFVVFFDVSEAVVAGVLSAGDFAVFFAYFVVLIGRTGDLGRLWFYLQDNVAGMHRVFQIMDLPSDDTPHGSAELSTLVTGIELRDVSYGYVDGIPALDGVSCHGKIGEMIAFVGATGAGKSTMSYLIPGFINPDEGQVLADGHDIRDYTVASLRRNIAFVFQEAVIFDDTVENNIRLGKPDATMDEIVQAATTAGASEFIDRLPEGYQTRVGRAGNMLSVGQKQRLSIARGLVSDARVLILDEPTASLDPETENALVAALNAERHQRLLIVIAHRLSTIRSADRIYFLEGGHVLESGPHDELMAQPDGAYRRFVNLQLS